MTLEEAKDQIVKAVLLKFGKEDVLDGDITEDTLAELTSLPGKLFTANSAASQPGVRDEVLKDVLTGIDKKLRATILSDYTDLGIDENKLNEIYNGNRKTTDKFAGILNVIKQNYQSKMEELSTDGKDDAKAKALSDQIAQVQKLLQAEKENANGLKTQLEKQAEEYRTKNIRNIVQGHYTSRKFKYDPDANKILINNLVDQAMRDAHLADMGDDGIGVMLKDAKDQRLVDVETSRPVTLENYLDRLGKTFYAKNDAEPKTIDLKTGLSREKLDKMPKHAQDAVQQNADTLSKIFG